MTSISGVSLMLTVTWSTAPAPSDRWVGFQRSCIAVGASGIALGRAAELAPVVAALFGTVYLAGLISLGVLLVVTVRQGKSRRFDPGVASYIAALSAGTIGGSIGVIMAAIVVDLRGPFFTSPRPVTNLTAAAAKIVRDVPSTRILQDLTIVTG